MIKFLRKIYFEIWYWFTESFYSPYGKAIRESRKKRCEFQRKYDIY